MSTLTRNRYSNHEFQLFYFRRPSWLPSISQKKILNPDMNNDMVIIDFWAEWCGPCKMFGPIFEEASNRHPDVVFAKVDTEQEQELAAYFQVRSIPMVVAFREQIGIFQQPGFFFKVHN